MLRVNAVKELPALSRMDDVDPLDREGPSDPRRVAEGREAGCPGVAVVGVRRAVILAGAIQSKVPVAAWADASCWWSRGVCVNGGSGPRPAVMHSVSGATPVNAATAIQLHCGGGPRMCRSVAGSESPTGMRFRRTCRRTEAAVGADGNNGEACPRLLKPGGECFGAR